MRTLRSSIRGIERQFEPAKRTSRLRSSHPPASHSSAFASRKPRQSSEPTLSDPPKTPTLRKLSPPHALATVSKKRSLPSAPSDEKRRRNESNEGLRTPPRASKPALSLRDYAQIEKERNFDAYKQRDKSVMQSLPSLDDLQLPKLPTRTGGRTEKREDPETQTASQESRESVKSHKQVAFVSLSHL